MIWVNGLTTSFTPYNEYKGYYAQLNYYKTSQTQMLIIQGSNMDASEVVSKISF